MLVAQFGLLISIATMGAINPRLAPIALVILTAITTFLTASHDTVNDAYRADLLQPVERASGSAMYTLGYRVATIVAGAGALVLSDHLPWSSVYPLIACLMIVGLVATWRAPEPEQVPAPATMSEAVVRPLEDLFSRPGAVAAVAFIMLYKFGDFMAADMVTPFLIKTGFSNTDIGAVLKTMGMIANIVGVLLGAMVTTALGVRRSLLLFGVLQAVMNAGYLGCRWWASTTACWWWASPWTGSAAALPRPPSPPTSCRCATGATPPPSSR
jgi:PAT family beta-lactamase induction signal transducer AmpG